MGEIQFLTIEQVLAIHEKVIEGYGGDPGIRDRGLIESAVMMPRQALGAEYLHPTIASMAAAYLFHLCSNHGFNDGNKRVAAGAALVFLDADGFELALTVDELEQITMGAAASKIDKAQLTGILEAACRSKSGNP